MCSFPALILNIAPRRRSVLFRSVLPVHPKIAFPMKKYLLALSILALGTLPAGAQSGTNNGGLGGVLDALNGILGTPADTSTRNGSGTNTNTNTGNTNGGNYGGYGNGNTNSGTNNSGNTIGGVLGSIFGNTGGSRNGGLSSLSSTEIARGLREALTVGARNAANQLSATNGFFGNAILKILLPPEAQKVESTLRSLGFSSLVDKTILSMNRAAEDAAGKAVPIFVNAITSITIQDGLSILQGGKGAATAYLKSKTTLALANAFRPVITSSLGKTGATSLWSNVFNTYNRLPVTRTKVNPDLAGYVTERALSGLFLRISDEENKIRTDPAARVTSILQEVFGAAAGGR